MTGICAFWPTHVSPSPGHHGAGPALAGGDGPEYHSFIFLARGAGRGLLRSVSGFVRHGPHVRRSAQAKRPRSNADPELAVAAVVAVAVVAVVEGIDLGGGWHIEGCADAECAQHLQTVRMRWVADPAMQSRSRRDMSSRCLSATVSLTAAET